MPSFLLINESNRCKSGMLETFVFTYTGLENILRTMQFSYSGQLYRENLSFQWWHIYVQFYRSFNPISWTTKPESSAKVNDCISSLLKSGKWVPSAFSFPLPLPRVIQLQTRTSTWLNPASLLWGTLCLFSELPPQLIAYGNQFLFLFWCVI